jgi:hypothetical protein
MLLDSSCVGGIIGGKWRAKKAGEAHDLAADILTATGLAHLRDKFRLFTCIAANEKERLNQHAEAGAILRYLSEASQRVCWR